MRIRKLSNHEQPPWDLLLLADPSEELVSAYVKAGTCYIAEAQTGPPVGVIVLLPLTDGKLEIVNLAVKETMQGKGIGTSLLKHGVKVARKSGYQQIEIGTGNSSINQLALYQKAGFRITGIERDFFIRNYAEPIYENGIQCRDMIRLSMSLSDSG
ncbi:GNAT family N-acetyltransferase [Mesobacillus subterraneus]|uniref:GNAT family N-acetyltransferase n=1 Tax=Mesobacillus subterraneus TaxID=285983 RepID=A0A3R9EB38_9BACI|nr:GNAT family N-acetyltransferase [Mesobacillus subterraneus]RSD26312.1 GNAT family N-acetyltransferase [Mesobacillus subterraneus]